MAKINWKSLKMLYAIGASVLLTAAWFATSHWSSLSPNFTIYKDGIVAIASFYLCAHAVSEVGQQWANKGSNSAVAPNPAPMQTNADPAQVQWKGNPK